MPLEKVKVCLQDTKTMLKRVEEAKFLHNYDNHMEM